MKSEDILIFQLKEKNNKNLIGYCINIWLKVFKFNVWYTCKVFINSETACCQDLFKTRKNWFLQGSQIGSWGFLTYIWQCREWDLSRGMTANCQQVISTSPTTFRATEKLKKFISFRTPSSGYHFWELHEVNIYIQEFLTVKSPLVPKQYLLRSDWPSLPFYPSLHAVFRPWRIQRALSLAPLGPFRSPQTMAQARKELRVWWPSRALGDSGLIRIRGLSNLR